MTKLRWFGCLACMYLSFTSGLST